MLNSLWIASSYQRSFRSQVFSESKQPPESLLSCHHSKEKGRRNSWTAGLLLCLCYSYLLPWVINENLSSGWTSSFLPLLIPNFCFWCVETAVVSAAVFLLNSNAHMMVAKFSSILCWGVLRDKTLFCFTCIRTDESKRKGFVSLLHASASFHWFSYALHDPASRQLCELRSYSGLFSLQILL